MRKLRNLPSHLRDFGLALSLLFTLSLAVSCGGGGGGGDGGGDGDGATGNQLGLDGFNDVVREAEDVVSPSPLDVTTFTIEAWIYPPDSVGMVASDSAYDLMVFASELVASVGFNIYGADGSGYAHTYFEPVTPNQWNHVAGMAGVIDGTPAIRVAVNGELLNPQQFTPTFWGVGLQRRFSVGIGSVSDLLPFTGRIDEVRISNVIRYTTNFTPAKVFSSDANTLGLWHFDESPGSTTFTDSSGNGHTLTGENGASIVTGTR